MLKKILKRYTKHRLFKDYGKSSRLVDLPGKVEIVFGEKIKFNGACYIGPGAFVDARGGIEIGRNVILAPKSVIISYNHDFKNSQWKPYSPENIGETIMIGDHTWIGYGVTLLAGVRLGENCVVAAGSVISKGDYPSGSIIGGNPARIIGSNLEKSTDAKEYQTMMSEKKRWG